MITASTPLSLGGGAVSVEVGGVMFVRGRSRQPAMGPATIATRESSTPSLGARRLAPKAKRFAQTFSPMPGNLVVIEVGTHSRGYRACWRA